MAKELGYYKDVGLDVELIEYDNTNITKDLEEQKIDYALTNSILSYHDKKLRDVTLVATYFQRSPLIFITQPEIKSVLDLKNKKIMISNDNRYNSSLSILLEYFNINAQNTTLLQPSFKLSDFIEKNVDVITAFRSNELFILDKKNVPYNVIDPVEHGFSTNAINLFVSHNKIKNNPQQIKNFLSATKKGWEYALSNIDKVAELIHLKYQPNKSIEHLAYEGRVTKGLMLLNMYEIGSINKEFVLKTYDQLLRNNKLNKDSTPDKLIFDPTQKAKPKPLAIDLTDQEKEWLKNNKSISFTGDPNWLPYEAFDKDGNYIGIVSEHLNIIEQKSGLSFKPIPVSSWTEALKSATDGKVKVISGDSADAILNKNFNSVDSYSQNSIVIIMDNKSNYVEKLKSIKNKKIVIIKDYGYTADIFKRYPDIKFIEVQNIQEGLTGVSEGKYDAMLATNALASYTIAEMGLHNIKIVGKTPIIMNLTLFVSKDEPLLWSIINKSLNNISQEQKHNILQKWVKQKYVEKIDTTLILKIIGFMLLIILVILFWSFKMKEEIRKRTILQDAYKAERDKNELYLDTAQVLIVALDSKARVTMLNKKGEELLEYTEDELLGKVWFEIGVLPKEMAENIRDFFDDLINLKEIDGKPFEHILITKSGKEIILSFTNSLLFDENKNVIGILSSATNITERVKAEQELKHQAEHDSLTGLPNRVLFSDRLKQSIKNAQRFTEKVAVIFIDLDNFKNVNDSLGHGVGDILLETIARKLKVHLRKSDTVARLGGDEFAIIIEHFEHLEIVISIIQNIMRSLKEPLEIEKHQIYTTLSLGISVYPEDATDPTALIKNADAAMYRAKHRGKNNYQFYTADMTEIAHERIYLETQLRQSIEKNQLEVYYQLQVNSLNESIVGMEALVRWNHPKRGMVSPNIFIPIAEEIGFIIQLDEWVMKEATAKFKDWYQKGLNPGVLSLNLAITRLEEEGFIQKISDMIVNNDAEAKWLSFEVTETKIMQNPERSIKHLNELSKLGINIAIDDFGTGYSSLSYLKKLPINKLKIDQSFVKDIPDDLDDVEITKTIISMANNLKLDLIAEGVETQEQRDFLLKNGCYEVQGYFYHKPSPANEVEERLKNLHR